MAFIKNIETKMKMALWIALASMLTSIIVSTMAFSYAKKNGYARRDIIYMCWIKIFR